MSDEHHHQEARPGWSTPKPLVIPRPTYAPAAMALGIMFFFWGLITSPIVIAVGLLVFGASLSVWIAEVSNEKS